MFSIDSKVKHTNEKLEQLFTNYNCCPKEMKLKTVHPNLLNYQRSFELNKYDPHKLESLL